MKAMLKGLFLCLTMHAFAQHSNLDLVLGKKAPELINNMQVEVYEAFDRMRTAAAKKGIEMKVVSAYRSYNRQREIWNAKYKAFTQEGLEPKYAIEKIITYSTLPGTSRHHWGTDIDIIDNANPQSGDVLLTEKFYDDGPSSAPALTTCSKSVLPRVYGYWSAITSTPRARAASIRSRAGTTVPQ